MVDSGEHRKVIKGHGAKGECHNAKLEILQDLAIEFWMTTPT
jgi:hypothetical protein